MATKRSGNYGGTDKRKRDRRTAAERRREVRWEPGKKIRRDGKDRRASGVVWERTRDR